MISLEKLRFLSQQLEDDAIIKKVPISLFNVTINGKKKEQLTMPIHWGGKEKVWRFKQSIALPNVCEAETIHLFFDIGNPQHSKDRTACEALLYINGERYFGIDQYHQSCDITADVSEFNTIDIEVEAFSGIVDYTYLFNHAELRVMHQPTSELARMMQILSDVGLLLSEHDLAKFRLQQILHETYALIDRLSGDDQQLYASVFKALSNLRSRLKDLPEDAYVPKVNALGHSHIDLAYLWQVKHTRRKAIHTFTSVLHLMDRYPEFTFIQSQPQIYEYLEQDAPELFEKIKERVNEGRWEVEGGMWVEADCNIPSGESLTRQLMYGIRYFEEKFNKRSRVLWLPDVFGYSYALPQILKQCGIDYFMTTKISWNDTNRPVNDTFWWEGIDGSTILTHFITTPEKGDDRYTYNGVLDAEHITGLWENYRQKDVNQHLLLAFGYGDGGGGPTEQMIETGQLLKHVPRMPNTYFGTSTTFFEALNLTATTASLPRWSGELYLEYHRGTYTSQANNKRLNRASEILFREVELWSSFIDMNKEKKSEVMQQLREGWKLILKNQFHDIIPGTGIAEVHDDSDQDYENIMAIGNLLLKQVLTVHVDEHSNEEDRLVVFNSLPWKRDEYIYWNGAHYWIEEIPSCGYKIMTKDELAENTKNQNTSRTWKISTQHLENDFFYIELNENGQISALWDKRIGKSLIAPGDRGNILELFEDRPMQYDNWNIDKDYTYKFAEINDLRKATVIENNDVKGVVRFEWHLNKSKVIQDMIIYRHRARIDFETYVDWQESQVLLKVAFPLDVYASFATYDIQFGNVRRPTHNNTSWEEAQFEVCAHKWVDLSDENHGVSLLNNCKYGHDIKGNTLRMTLLKSGIYPDPKADRGEHRFSYSLFPHANDWLSAGTVKEAYEFNVPVQTMAIKTNTNIKERSWLEMISEHVMLETVKIAEDGQGIIIRLNEFGNKTGEVIIDIRKNYSNAEQVNLLEEHVTDLRLTKQAGGCRMRLNVKPYEIKTIRLY